MFGVSVSLLLDVLSLHTFIHTASLYNIIAIYLDYFELDFGFHYANLLILFDQILST